MRLLLLFVVALAIAAPVRADDAPREKPNVVVIFLDDSGWADFHPFGDPPYDTPNVERLAAGGTRYNRFQVPQAICSASRAALLTGCWPERVHIYGALGPDAYGLDPGYATLGETLQAGGYTTGAFGKWHLGDKPETRPPARGFHESAGIMYSNDMWDHHPENPDHWGRHPLRWWVNGQIEVERITPDFQRTMTGRITRRAVDFIERHAGGPFFAYVAHPMPHVPLYCSERFAGKSGAGLYGDVILELDHSIGQILDALQRAGVEQNTLVFFSSDNGPWAVYGDHAGKTPFREAKATSFAGGTQSACVIKYPSAIAAGGSSDALFTSTDLAPTLCALAGAPLPANDIDGRNVWPLLTGESGATNPHDYYPVTTVDRLEAVVSGDGRWKLHLPHRYRYVETPGAEGRPGHHGHRRIELSLFDLKNDPMESTNVAEQHPEVTERLHQMALAHAEKFGVALPD